MKGNFDDRVAATFMSGFSNIWLSFVEISEKYLNPLYSENETLKFYWIGGRKLFFMTKICLITHQESSL